MISLVCAIAAFALSAQALADEGDSARSAGDTSVVADGSTFDSWQDLLYTNDQLTTENVGRIWTDKTVFTDGVTLQGDDGVGGETITNGGSDFLVALSALSSTSSLTTSSTTPLDIVLVLDVSGSMDDPISYAEVYSLDQSRTYYVLVDGGYVELKYQSQGWQRGWYYGSDWDRTWVTPKTSANGSGTQVYDATASKMDALKTAVNSFINATAAENDKITDVNSQHEIALVKFAGTKNDNVGNSTYRDGSRVYNYSQRVSTLTAYTSGNASTLTDMVNDIDAAGATSADYGMELAKTELDDNRRTNAQQVIIFFTDGEPNHGGGFWCDVAAQTVNLAQGMKGKDVVIYSVGVFQDADPSSTDDNFNIYMHGVSSNYPDASATSQGSDEDSQWTPSLGTRAENSDYYKAATDADELNSIFRDIQSEISSNVGIPTDTTTTGGFHNDGYITFTDQLGDYMQVDGFKDLIYHGVRYLAPDNPDPEGAVQADGSTVYTYTYTASVSGNGGTTENDTNLSNIKITVTRSADAKTGDKVEVSIPAALIPLRNFDVKASEGGTATMTCNEAYPIRIFYGVSVKDGILEPITNADGSVTPAAISNPDEDLQAYLDAHKTSDGAGVVFYSNKWSGGDNGDTTSAFTPSASNGFYYFAESTPVYVDEACTQPATGADITAALEAGGTQEFYYQRSYYVTTGNGDAAELQEEVCSFPAKNFGYGVNNFDYQNGQVVINPKAHRVTHVNENTFAAKASNTTGTAANAINPKFDDENAGGPVTVYLGNNGMLTAELSGSLVVRKTVEIPDDLTGPQSDDPQVDPLTFTYTLTLTGADTLPKELQVQKTTFVENADGTISETPIQGEPTTLTAGADGTFTFTLQDGQAFHVYGLDAGLSYTVTEKGTAGFVASVDGKTGEKGKDFATTEGATIVAGASATVAFTNTYAVDPVTLLGSDNLKVQKVLTGREWADGDSFTFKLEAVSYQAPDAQVADTTKGTKASMPLPEGGSNGVAELKVTNGNVTNFGDIEFTKPGTYVYTITEPTPSESDRIVNVDYSDAVWRVTVIVSDKGDGTLAVSSKMAQTFKDDGEQVADPQEVSQATAAITNTYVPGSTDPYDTKAGVGLNKELTGRNWTDADSFVFDVTKVSYNGSADESALALMPDPATPVTVTAGGLDDNGVAPFGFGQLTFTQAGTYVYQVTERNAGQTLAGVTYSTNVATVTIVVRDDTAQGKLVVDSATVTSGTATFTNTYVVEVDFDEAVDFTLSKTMYGRDMTQGEFSFKVAANATGEGDTAVSAEEAAARIGIPEGTSGMVVGAAGVNGQKVEMGKGAESLTFTVADSGKTFSYTFSEVQPADGDGVTTDENGNKVANGVTYDGTTYTMDVTPTDNGDGTMTITTVVTTHNARGEQVGEPTTQTWTTGDTAKGAVALDFVNSYKASGKLDGEANLKVSKTLTGRDSAVDEQFIFAMTPKSYQADARANAETEGANFDAMPQIADVTIGGLIDGEAKDSNFADITFTKPGIYTYTIVETAGAANLDYSKATYEVKISVVDENSDGTLVAQVTAFTKLTGDDGTAVSGDDANLLESKTASFVNKYAATTPTKDVRTNGEDPTTSVNGQLVGVGDTLTYVITWTNDAMDNTGAPAKATVTVTDTIPAGTELVEDSISNGGSLVEVEGTKAIKWDLSEQDANATGTVSFKVRVTDAAVNNDGNAITNTASVQVGNNDPKTSTEVKNTVPEKSVTDAKGQELSSVKVGDTLTYTVAYTNTESEAATVTVTDTLPAGLTVDESSISEPGSYNSETRTITWTIEGVEPGASGEVSFIAVVNEAAVTGSIANQAQVAVGDNPSVNTNTTPDVDPTTGSLTVSKTVVSSDAGVTAPSQTFEFTITLTGADGNALAGTYAYTGNGVDDGELTFNNGVANVSLASDQSVTINGLPEGASYTVTEATVDSFASSAEDSTGTIAAAGNTAAFTNTYTPGSQILTGEGNLDVSKTLTGRAWQENESFSFQISKVSYAANAEAEPETDEAALEAMPMPTNGTITLSAPAEGDTQHGSFGDIAFTKTGIYTYKISETGTSADKNLSFSKAEYQVVVTVTGNADGTLNVSSVMTQVTDDAGEVTGATADVAAFTNTYTKPDQTKDVAITSGDTTITDADGKLVGVGDMLTYTITWVNNAVDSEGKAAAAKVIVTDTVPTGTTLVDTPDSATYDKATRTLTWTIDNAEPNATGTVSFAVTVDKPSGNATVDPITNTATVKLGDNDPGQQTNPVENPVPEKTETTNPGSIKVGQTLTYQITFKNTDGEGASATVVDTLSDGLLYEGGATYSVGGGEAAGLEPNVNGQVLTWELGSLPPDATITITFSVTVTRDALTTVDNSATVNGHATNVVTTPVPTDDAKHAYDATGAIIDGKLVGVGDAITYAIDWANGDVAGDVEIVDTLPAGVTVNETISDGGIYDAAAGTITWTLANRQAGERGTVSFTVTVADEAVAEAGQVATLTNRAIVNGVEVSVTNYVPGKSHADSTPETGVQVGDVLTYTIAYKNTESAAATVTVTDTVPAGTELVNAGGATASTDADGKTTLTWTISDVAAGTEGTVSFTVRVTENALQLEGGISNQAIVKIGDNDPGYRTNTDTIPQVKSGSLSISKTVVPYREGIEPPDQTFVFTVAVVSSDDRPVTGAFTYEGEGVEGGTLMLGETGEGTIEFKGGQAVTIAGLPAGATATVTETPVDGYVVDNNPQDAVIAPDGTASISFTNTYYGDTPDTKDVTKVVGDVVTSVDGKLVGVGDDLTYTISWVNDAVDSTGKAAAAAVTVTDKVPAGTELVDEGGATASTDDDGATILTWELGEQQAGATGTVSFTVRVTDEAVSVDAITNQANVQVGDTEPRQTNQTTVTVPEKSVTDATGQQPGTVKVGDELVYTIEWANTTDESATVVVSDALPVGLTFLEASDGGAHDAESNTVTWDLGSQPSGAAGVVTVRVVVNDRALTTSIDNTATLNIGDKPFISTNKVPGPEVQPGEAHLVISKQVTVEPGRGIDEAQARSCEFTFTVSLTDTMDNPVTGEFDYTLQNADGNTESGTLVLDTAGMGMLTLRDGQSIEISGLPSGSTYTVTEDHAAGYTTFVPNPDLTAEQGMIEGNKISGVLAAGQALAVANFQNHYDVTEATLSGADNLVVTKALLGRAWTEGDSFSFVLAANANDTATKAALDAGAITLPGNATGITIDASTPDSVAAFGDITFSRAGYFQFLVSESLPDGVSSASPTKDGVTYDTAQRLVTIHVADNGEGTLTASVASIRTTAADGTLVDANLTFSNVYGATTTVGAQGATQLVATKTLTGRPQDAGEFSFEVRNGNNALVATATSTQADEATPAVLNFSDITYELGYDSETGMTYVEESSLGDGAIRTTANEQGEYVFTYTVSELTNNLPAQVGAVGDASFTVTVVVTDNGDGTLTPRIVYPEGFGEGLAFTNAYAAGTEAYATIGGTKVVEGLPEGTYLKAGEYSFHLQPLTEGDGDRAADVTVVSDGVSNVGTFGFSLTYTTDDLAGIDYTDDGQGGKKRFRTFTYQVSEIDQHKFGVAYDTTSYTVDVTLTDDGMGNLSTTTVVTGHYAQDGTLIDQPDGITFTNTYDESSIQWTPSGFKSTSAVEGVDLSGVGFGFLVTDIETGKVVSSGTSAANGSITFTPITLGSEGWHAFAITELRSGADGDEQGGITYDSASYTVELTVTRVGNGVYSFDAVYTNNLTGEVTDQAYFYNEYASTGTSIDLSATKTITAPHTAAGFQFAVIDNATGQQVAAGTSDANGAVTFNPIYYSYGQTTVALPALDGLTADQAIAALNGVQLQSTTVEGEAAPSAEQAGLVYRAVVDGAEVASGTQVATSAVVELWVYGPAAEQNDEAVEGQDSTTATDATTPEPGAEPSAGDMGEGGDASSTPVDDPAAGDATVPGESDASDGAGSEGDVPSDGMTPEGDPAVFDEPIAESVEAALPEAQAVEGASDEGSIADLFEPTVAIADDEGAEPYVSEAPIDPGMSVASTDLGDHWYTIYEIDDAQAGVTYDATYYLVRVSVIDNGDGTMSASVTKVERVDASGATADVTLAGANGMANVVFANEYQADQPVAVTLEGTKTLTGRSAAAGEFAFTVTNTATDEVVTGGQSGAASDGQAAPISFGTFWIEEAGEYDYVVSEAQGGTTRAGVTYDDATFSVHVSVTDNGDGTLSAQVSYPDGAIAFENGYRATEGTSATIEGTKALTGRDASAGEFGFVIVDETGATVATGQSTAATDGTPSGIVFGKLNFDAQDVGDHTYTVSEVNAGQTLAGVTYDATTYRVTVHVVDNLDGTISATVEYPDGSIAFKNSYQATGGDASTVTPQATKTLTGREMKAGEFTFALKDASTGEVVSLATNAADGSVSFSTLSFAEEGEFAYEIVEVAGREEGMTYDTAVFRLQVSVADDGKGSLVATASYPDGTPTFKNSYEKPKEPVTPSTPTDPSTPSKPSTPTGGGSTPSIPKTGDATPGVGVTLALGMAGFAAAGLGAGTLLRLRRPKRRG